MSDYIIRATAANHQIRAFGATTRQMVEDARLIHNSSPVVTAALGRLLTGGAMMGSMMKGEKDILTLQMRGDGPMVAMTVTADSNAYVKGYAVNPDVRIPPNYLGKLDVGAAIGYGNLTVIKDMGLKEPYSGQVPLNTGEVAEDLAYYFAKSEQVPSAVALGVLMEKNNTVKQAGGFIIQLMPFTDEDTIDKLEKKIAKITSITSMLEKGMTPEDILQEVLGEFGLTIQDKLPTGYRCNCSEKRVARAIMSIGRKDLQEMIEEGKDIEVNCDFCNKSYVFSVEDLKAIIAGA